MGGAMVKRHAFLENLDAYMDDEARRDELVQIIRPLLAELAETTRRATDQAGADVPIADGGTGASDAATAFGNLKQAATDSATGVVEKGTVAEVRSSASDKYISADLVESASAVVGLTDAATVAVDWDAFINADVTLTASRALGNPTNVQVGTFRTILVKGNNSTDRTLTFGSNYEGDVPTLTDIDDGKWYLLTLYAYTATHIVVSSATALKP